MGILDASYEKSDLPKVNDENCSHLSFVQQSNLLNLLRKLKKIRENNALRDMLAIKYDRETLEEFLQLNIIDIDEILRNCNFSENFIRTANDLQILEAISGCYEEYKVLSRR